MGWVHGLICVAALAACGGDSGSSASWATVADGQSAALLSVWAGSDSDVWVVGGNPADNSGPLVFHYDGTGWTKLSTGLTNVDLWWVKGFDDGVVMLTGSKGTILRYHPDTGAFEPMTTPETTVIVFGLWGATSNDVWAVGGAGGGGNGGFAWHNDGGSSWAVSPPSFPADLATAGTVWKVNGTASDNVWMSGTNGTTLHWNGTTLERMDVADAQEQQASLFSIAANDKFAVTVGGATTGVLFENSGSGWTSALPAIGNFLSGVTVSEDDAYAVGQGGTILHRANGKWVTDKQTLTFENLHAAFIDPAGGVWAVGGEFEGHPTTAGVVLHKGDALKGSFP